MDDNDILLDFDVLLDSTFGGSICSQICTRQMFGWIHDWIYFEHITVALFWETYDLKELALNRSYGTRSSTKVNEASPHMCELI